MALLTDIRRSRTGALPWGPSQADQDALYWDAVDVVTAAEREVADKLSKTGGSNG